MKKMTALAALAVVLCNCQPPTDGNGSPSGGDNGSPSGDSGGLAPAVAFSAPVVLTCNHGTAGRVLKGDFNGDKQPDLAVACNSAYAGYSVFFNQGNGTFSAPQLLADGFDWDMWVLDVDGDGIDDLVAGDWTAMPGGDPNAKIWFGDKSGKFQTVAAPNFPTGCEYKSDLNGDGRPDALCYSLSDVWALSIHADGTAKQFYSSGAPGTFVGAVDVDRDGKVDLVFSQGASLMVQYGTGAGAFSAAKVAFSAAESMYQVWLTDIDGDGLTDLAYESYASKTLNFVRNTGVDFTVMSYMPLPQLTGQGMYTIADATGDGIADVITTQIGTSAILSGHGDGSFEQNAVQLTGPWSTSLSRYYFLFDDLDGDGKADVTISADTVSVMLRQ